MDSNQDAIEVFQKALLQAQNNAESKQEPSDTVDENLDSQVVFSGKVSSDSATGAQLNPFPGIGKKEPFLHGHSSCRDCLSFRFFLE